MRRCVACEVDYKVDVHRCPDCGSRTLDRTELALWNIARDELSQESFVPVGTLEGPVEAGFVDEVFRVEDIPHIVHSYTGDSFGPLWQPQHGWGVLLVLEDDLGRARLLLQQIRDSTELPS